MIHFKNVAKIFFLPILLMLVMCSCGNDGGKTTETVAPAKVAETAPKAVEVSLSTETTPEPAVAIDEAPVEEASKEKAMEEKPKKKVKKPRAKIVFDEPTHDYGFIMQGDKVKHDFHFRNIGDDDLLITRVKASCGCTTPDYPKDVIPPGGSGKIAVVFNSSGKLGRQNPTVDVYTNYQRRKTVRLQGFVDAERAKAPTVIKEKIEEETADEKMKIEEVKEVIDEKIKVEVDTTGGI